ncbi:multimeric flavodoxin WrbA [Glaciihabitans tibetensis]|uniref:Multimeric flavodoxin WrbA n=1 Tax=Glaciihabitans tibetensis TaxID=1266600 RepID=A0A2T0VC47_9MICO|nr:flavodoxin family protein [Glaciihabitans tibetensis]PRY67648.1 multimeric flavodoxin WrbA [Glaciihabitans tibetensis]
MENSSVTSSGTTPLSALALVCSLKPSPAPSSSELMASQILAELAGHGVTGSSVRVVDYNVAPGVETDMGNGDQWPTLRDQVLAADILVVCTPTWMGQASSVAHRVLERLDAELSEMDAAGRPDLYDKVAVVGVVGNEDGAHHITAVLYQSLNDVGFTIPSQGGTYWNGEAMQGTDYNDLDETPEAVASATKSLASNAAHLARLLKGSAYPAS